MFLDGALADAWRTRTARDAGIEILVSAWRGFALDHRAELLAARGELHRAGACGGEGWQHLAAGDVVGALRAARQTRPESGRRHLSVLEAEALFAAGAFVAGLKHLGELHARGDVAGTIALARRRHMLADHRGAARIAAFLPMHAHAALVGARAALVLGDVDAAWRRVLPFLEGVAPLPDPGCAGGFAVVAASVLARRNDVNTLRRFASGLLLAPDLPPEMMPTAARTAWVAGLAEHAWERFSEENDPWAVTSRLELASLTGDAALVRGLIGKAGPLGAPAAATLLLLGHRQPELESALAEDGTCHIWRTHPHRWQPWIDAARSVATVEVYDLARNELPDEQVVPRAALDDGSLLGMIEPLPVPAQRARGTGVWIDSPLCKGIGAGHDWPDEESAALRKGVSRSPRSSAAVWVVGADRALAHAHEGRPTVVIAPPGDPFWAGGWPERVWPAMRVIRAAPRERWTGAGARAAQAAMALAQPS